MQVARGGKWDLTLIAVLLLFCAWAFVYVPWGWEGFRHILGSDAAAAWLQAIGSVGAIFAAVALSRSAERSRDLYAQEQQRKQDVSRLQQVGAALMYLYYLTLWLRVLARDSRSTSDVDTEIGAQLDLLTRVNLLDVPDSRATVAITGVRRSIFLIEREAKLLNARQTHPDHLARFNREVERELRNMRRHVRFLREALKDKRADLIEMQGLVDGVSVSMLKVFEEDPVPDDQPKPEAVA